LVADLDGSLWAAEGKFLGWLLHADTAALFDPDWLQALDVDGGPSTRPSMAWRWKKLPGGLLKRINPFCRGS